MAQQSTTLAHWSSLALAAILRRLELRYLLRIHHNGQNHTSVLNRFPFLFQSLEGRMARIQTSLGHRSLLACLTYICKNSLSTSAAPTHQTSNHNHASSLFPVALPTLSTPFSSHRRLSELLSLLPCSSSNILPTPSSKSPLSDIGCSHHCNDVLMFTRTHVSEQCHSLMVAIVFLISSGIFLSRTKYIRILL
jgi:hypothetical protein